MITQIGLKSVRASEEDLNDIILTDTFRNKVEKQNWAEYTKEGVEYYYLLRDELKIDTLYESHKAKDLYQKMEESFERQLQLYLSNIRGYNEGEKYLELADFYLLMEKCYGSLEVIYDKKDFIDGAKRSYEKKMNYRKFSYFFHRKYLRWFEYFFLEKTTKYGDSFLRWGVTSLAFTLLCAIGFFVFDQIQPDMAFHTIQNGHLYDYFYFSMQNLTSLGAGDFLAKTFLAKMLVTFQVFFGYIMLGMFITLLQKKI